MNIIIQEATIEDAAMLARLNMAVQKPHVEAMPERYRALTPDDPGLIRFFQERLELDNSHTFIAMVDSEPAGYIHCLVQRTPDNVFVISELDFHIDQLAVLETHQGQGIGQALMEHAIQLAKDFGADRLSLGVVAFNHGAIRFYERLGFKISSHRMRLGLNEK